VYGKKWQYICENFYNSRFTPEALIYQYKMAIRIKENMKAVADKIISGEYEID